jgi:type I restriction enzyme S subunit
MIFDKLWGRLGMKFSKVRLGDVANITMGQSPKSDFFNHSGNGIEFLQGVRTFGDLVPQFDTFTTEFNREAEEGDILFSVRAPVGNVNWADRKIAIGRGLAAVHSKKVDQTFLFYTLKSIGGVVDSQSNGTVFTSINKKEMASLEITIPDDRLIQEKIGNTLQSLDRKIAKNKKINDNLVA